MDCRLITNRPALGSLSMNPFFKCAIFSVLIGLFSFPLSAADSLKIGHAGRKKIDVSITSSREDSTTAIGFTFVPANEPIDEEEEAKAKKGELTFEESPLVLDFGFSFYQSRLDKTDRSYNLQVGGDYTFNDTYLFGLSIQVGRSSLDQMTRTEPMAKGGIQMDNLDVYLALGWIHYEQEQSASGELATTAGEVYKFNQRVVGVSADWELNKQWSLMMAITRYLIDSDVSNRVNSAATGSKFVARRNGLSTGSVENLASLERKIGLTYEFSRKWVYDLLWIQSVEHLSQSSSTDTSFSVNWGVSPKVRLGGGLGVQRSIDSVSGYGLVSMTYGF